MGAESARGDGAVPTELAAHVLASSEDEEPVETLRRLYGSHDEADAAQAMALIGDLLEGEGDPTGGVEAGADARHEVDLGDRVEPAACTDGALFAAEAAPVETVTVRSTDPVRDEVVRFERDSEGWSVTPADAVASIGMAAEATAEEDLLTAGTGFAEGGCVDDRAAEVVCRNFNAFVDVASYEQWAERADAVSVGVPATVFAAMLREVAERIDLA